MTWSVLLSCGPGALAGDTVAGTWLGRYACTQGTTGLALRVDVLSPSRVHALFHFFADASNPAVPEGCFEMDGVFDPRTRRIELKAGRWLSRPYGFVTVDLAGRLAADGGTMSGQVIGPSRTSFELHPAGIRVPPDDRVCRTRGDVVASVAQP